MPQQFNVSPTYDQKLTEQGNTSRGWWRFWQNLYNGVPPTAEATVTAGTSPYTYTAARGGFLIVQGGTVSLVQWSRGNVANHTTGVTQGCFPLSAGDSLVITHTGAPTLTFVPQ